MNGMGVTAPLDTTAVILTGPGELGLGGLSLAQPGPTDIVVDVAYSGISTGTERLFYEGRMPPFPGMGYPLVPGYEAAGEVVEAGVETPFQPGDFVFVPGSSSFNEAKGLFGGAASRIVSPAARAVKIDRALREEGALLALAATARHAMAGLDRCLPELIVGHGVLGRLLARITVAAGGPPPVVWETNADRQSGALGYDVVHPDTDERRDYASIYDATGADGILNSLMGRITKGGEIVLAGFYANDVSFAFPPAFMKEARLRVAAEWTEADLIATRALIETGALSLADLVTHRQPANAAPSAYAQAFDDPACLKMILDWEGHA